jgi:hypothetical protein
MVCKLLAALVTLLLTLTTIAAAIGVWVTHHGTGAWVFGTMPGSIALFTFIVSLLAWFKVFKKMCPCGKGGCGSGCGGGSCGGGCPGCGNNPCSCK